jgi:SNF2 family DNA or RNA helicase
MYSGSEKFLIFSQFPLSLAQVVDGLDLMEVKYLQLTTQVSPKAREHAIVTFESCDTYRVLLMDLKHGARGL